MSEAVEQQIAEKNLNAPRITPSRIDEVIVAERYHIFPGTTVTVCCLTLANGFTVVGESACASPENFDKDLGERIAHEDAKRKIWALEGYLLREKLAGRCASIDWAKPGSDRTVEHHAGASVADPAQ